MTEQTDAAEVEALASLLSDAPGGITRLTAWLLASDWLAAREAAAEARGAQTVLAAVAGVLADTEWYCADDHDWGGRGTLVDRLLWVAARAATAAAAGGA